MSSEIVKSILVALTIGIGLLSMGSSASKASAWLKIYGRSVPKALLLVVNAAAVGVLCWYLWSGLEVRPGLSLRQML
jgi:hypothetical protein